MIDIDDEKLSNINALVKLVERRESVDRDFGRAIGTLKDDLVYIDNALRAEPAKWRQNKAFHIVHVPSFLAIMSIFDDMDQMVSVSDDEKHQILISVHRAAQLAKVARRRMEQSKLTDAKTELEVLAQYAAVPDEPYQKPSRLTRALDGLASASDSAWQGAKSHARAMPNLVSGLQSGVSGTLSRAASAPALFENLQKTVSGALSDTVLTPISMRLNAGGRALKHGVGAGVGLGVVAGVLCPPLLPLTAGGAVLAAMRAWRKDMDKAATLHQAEREQRIAELQSERKAALRHLTYGAPALQMETEDLSMTVDIETGRADAVILKGEHSGRLWSNLSPADKAELGMNLAEGAASLLSILELAIKD
ncbi:MAG: hypothetical protein AAFX90_07125 [Pseudomonadota bacterium]